MNYSGVMGLQAAILHSKNDGKTRLRISQGELTRCGENGYEALESLGAEVEVLYREEDERPIAEAHCVVLRNCGLIASICPV